MNKIYGSAELRPSVAFVSPHFEGFENREDKVKSFSEPVND